MHPDPKKSTYCSSIVRTEGLVEEFSLADSAERAHLQPFHNLDSFDLPLAKNPKVIALTVSVVGPRTV